MKFSLRRARAVSRCQPRQLLSAAAAVPEEEGLTGMERQQGRCRPLAASVWVHPIAPLEHASLPHRIEGRSQYFGPLRFVRSSGRAAHRRCCEALLSELARRLRAEGCAHQWKDSCMRLLREARTAGWANDGCERQASCRWSLTLATALAAAPATQRAASHHSAESRLERGGASGYHVLQ